MAFSKEYRQPQRWDTFHFYFSGKANGWESQSLAIGKLWALKEVRLHFSSTFASTEDFTVTVSSINGSSFNQILLSEPLNGLRDLIQQFSDPLLYFSDDQLVFGASMKSNINGYGLEVIGWAVRG